MKEKRKVFRLSLFVFFVVMLLPVQVFAAQKSGITLTIVSNDHGLKDIGHAFLVITNNTSKTLSVGPYAMGRDKQVTLGMRDGYRGHLSEAGGAYYNVEAATAKLYKDFAYKKIAITRNDVSKISEFFKKNSYYETEADLLFHNCTTFAVRAWNLVAPRSEQIEEDTIDEPWKLKERIKKMSGGKTGTSLVGTVLTKSATRDQVYYMRMDGKIIPYCPVKTGFLEIKTISCSEIQVKWKGARDTRISGQNMITGYKLYYGIKGKTLDNVIKITDVKTTQYKVSGLDTNKIYSFQIVPIFEKYGCRVDGIASAINTKKTKSCKVNLNRTNVTINVLKNKRVRLSATSTGHHSGELKKVKWSSNNRSVATVNSTGLVTGKKHGTAVITATIHGVQKRCKVYVNNPTIKLNKSKVNLKKGTTYTLKATVTGKSKSVVWKSSNSNVVVVKDGKIKAKKEGSAIIIAKANGVSAKCKVTVRKKNIVNHKTIDITKYLGMNYQDVVAATGGSLRSSEILIQKVLGTKKEGSSVGYCYDVVAFQSANKTFTYDGTIKKITITTAHNSMMYHWTSDELMGSYSVYGIYSYMMTEDAESVLVNSGWKPVELKVLSERYGLESPLVSYAKKAFEKNNKILIIERNGDRVARVILYTDECLKEVLRRGMW